MTDKRPLNSRDGMEQNNEGNPIAPVLVTGATGYIGGRLVSRLLDAGYPVRCLVREPRKLESRVWINQWYTSYCRDNSRQAETLKASDFVFTLQQVNLLFSVLNFHGAFL